MQTEMLQIATSAAGQLSNPANAGAPESSATPFAGVLKDAMTNLQTLEAQATSTIEGLVAGRGVDIHQAMIATQKSDLAFEMALAVRGKLVSAYESMMGVQF
jgi:flagellar hook-basal body complex protein FliE